MLQHSQALPRLDLAHHHLTALSLSLSVDWDDDLDNLFGWDTGAGDLVSDLLGEGLPLIFPYKRSHVAYAILAYAEPSPTSEDEMLVGIRYTVVPMALSPFTQAARVEDEFLRHLRRLPPKGPVMVLAEYGFGGVAPADLWYPLPNRIGAPPDSPLVEIQGIRGARLNDAGDHTEFTFTLDREEADGDVTLLMEFAAAPRFDKHTPDQVLEQANSYARMMVHA